MAGNFYTAAYAGSLLNFYKRANAAVITNLAAIKINKGINFNVLPQVYIWRDSGVLCCAQWRLTCNGLSLRTAFYIFIGLYITYSFGRLARVIAAPPDDAHFVMKPARPLIFSPLANHLSHCCAGWHDSQRIRQNVHIPVLGVQKSEYWG